MIINTEVNKTVTSSNMKGSAMTVNITGTSFNFILDNLYTQPHRAIVRELSCNAWDAHVQAGNVEPFWIQVPSKFNQTFIIRDFGVGLNPEEIDKYLNTLYQSSKGGTNDQIGGFGLGAKSPFALVQSFFISSYKDGMEYKCFWYRDSEGIPILKVQSQKETTEANGIKYIINFALKDVDGIIRACSSELLGLPVTPRFFSDIENHETEFDLIGQSNISRTVETDKYLIIKDSGDILNNTFIRSSAAYARSPVKLLLSIGGVLYPLPSSLNSYELNNAVPGFSALFDNAAYFVIKLPIGSVKLPSTREHILDTSENREIIKEHANISMSSFLKTLKEEYFNQLSGKDLTSFTVHLEHLYKYCKANSVNYQGAVIAFIDDSVLIDGIALNYLKQHPTVLAQTSAATLLFECGSIEKPMWNSKLMMQQIPIFKLKKVCTTTYRTSNSRYDVYSKIEVVKNKTLIVFDDAPKFMGAWLAALPDISTYTHIYRCVLNQDFDSSLSPYTNHLYELAESFFNAYGFSDSKLIKSSSLVKPANTSTGGTNAVNTPVPIPGIRVAKNLQYLNESYTNGADPIYKVKDANDKYIPFDSSYIKATGTVGYMIKEPNMKYIDYRLNVYYRSLGITTLYFIREAQEQTLLTALKATPAVTKIVKVDPSSTINLDHVDPELLTQFFNFYQICLNVTDGRLRNMILTKLRDSFNLLDQEKIDSILTNYNTLFTYSSEIQATIKDVDIRTLVCFDINANLGKYASVDEVGIIQTLDEKDLIGIVKDSLNPMMFNIIKHLLSLKEKE